MDRFGTESYVNTFLLLFSIAVVVGMLRHASPETVLFRAAVAAGLSALVLRLSVTALHVVVARYGKPGGTSETTEASGAAPDGRHEERDGGANGEPLAAQSGEPRSRVS